MIASRRWSSTWPGPGRRPKAPATVRRFQHLDTADRLAPQRIRNDPIARDLVLNLDRQAPRRVWELDGLRNRFGLGGRGSDLPPRLGRWR